MTYLHVYVMRTQWFFNGRYTGVPYQHTFFFVSRIRKFLLTLFNASHIILVCRQVCSLLYSCCICLYSTSSILFLQPLSSDLLIQHSNSRHFVKFYQESCYSTMFRNAQYLLIRSLYSWSFTYELIAHDQFFFRKLGFFAVHLKWKFGWTILNSGESAIIVIKWLLETISLDIWIFLSYANFNSLRN